jgi:hypothetical protein
MAISIRPYKASDAKTLTNLFRDSVRAIPRAITLGALTARDVSAEEGDDSAIEVTMKSYTVDFRWIDADFGRLLCKGLITWCHENKMA